MLKNGRITLFLGSFILIANREVIYILPPLSLNLSIHLASCCCNFLLLPPLVSGLFQELSIKKMLCQCSKRTSKNRKAAPPFPFLAFYAASLPTIRNASFLQWHVFSLTLLTLFYSFLNFFPSFLPLQMQLLCSFTFTITQFFHFHYYLVLLLSLSLLPSSFIVTVTWFFYFHYHPALSISLTPSSSSLT